MNILLLEDEVILKESIVEFLTTQNYIVDSFINSDDAFDAIYSKEYDLLLLDVNVPGKRDGFELRKELAQNNTNIPTIFVTSMSSADALIQGYAHGCCDYIRKPFDLTELLLRVQQAIKSNCFNTKEDYIELSDNCKYNIKTFVLTQNNEVVSLSKREIDILNLFIIYRKKILSCDVIYEQIWDNDVDAANARVQINNLRRKLPKGIIKNIYGLGYRLDC